MKDIKKYYQDLIKDINISNDKIVSGLKNHITWLESKMLKLQEEIEKLKSGSQLQNEVDEYNRLEAQNNMNLEDDLAAAKSKINELVADVNSARASAEEWETRFYTLVKAYGIDLNKPVKTSAVVHHCGEGEPKVYKPKKKHTGGKAKGVKLPKNILRHCVDCKKYYYAASKLSKRCESCADEYRRKYQREWMKNHPKKK